MGAVLSLDHIRPCAATERPDNSSENLTTSCRSCNSAKGAMSMRAWYKVLRASGLDASAIGRRIRTRAKRDLAPYRAQAKTMLASLDAGDYANTGELTLVAG